MPRPALRSKASKKDQSALKKLLASVIERIRVVLRAVALQRLGEGSAAALDAAIAVRNVAHRYE